MNEQSMPDVQTSQPPVQSANQPFASVAPQELTSVTSPSTALLQPVISASPAATFSPRPASESSTEAPVQPTPQSQVTPQNQTTPQSQVAQLQDWTCAPQQQSAPYAQCVAQQPPQSQIPVQQQVGMQVQSCAEGIKPSLPSHMDSARLPEGVMARFLDDNGGPIFPPADLRFNCGAFLLNVVHALCHRQYKVGAVLFGIQALSYLIHLFLPFLGFFMLLVFFAACCMYGKVGYRAACLGKHYASVEELMRRERKYAIIGSVLIFMSILLVMLALFINFFLLMIENGAVLRGY